MFPRIFTKDGQPFFYKEKMKTCYKCKKEIDKQDYFSFTGHSKKGDGIEADYVHGDCWNEVKRYLKATDEASEILRGLKKTSGLLKKLSSEDK